MANRQNQDDQNRNRTPGQSQQAQGRRDGQQHTRGGQSSSGQKGGQHAPARKSDTR